MDFLSILEAMNVWAFFGRISNLMAAGVVLKPIYQKQY